MIGAPMLDPVDLLKFEHSNLKLAQLLLIAHLVLEPTIEIEFGEREPRLDLYCGCHSNGVSISVASRPAVKESATV
jgi:hypothetical protein